MPNPRKLLILDLDETLIYATETPLLRQPDFHIGQYSIYRRPHVDEFIGTCLQWFDVAVWTSASPLYAQGVVAALFPDPGALAFVWASPRCTWSLDPETMGYDWRKNLKKVRRLGYAREAVLAVDDSPEKWRQSYGNLVRVSPYVGADQDDELRLLLPYLESLRDVENVRAIEKRFWRTQ